MYLDTVLLDIEVQRDFFAPGGVCYTAGSARAARCVCRLFAWARRRRIPIISTVLRNRPHRKGPLASAPHCVEGTRGERRPPGTLMPRYINFGLRGTTDLPRDVFDHYQQVIFEKRFTDIFAHARAERLLTEMRADSIIVCGAGSAQGVVEAVVGLRQRGFKVVLAADAILDLGHPLAEMAWLRMFAKGAVPLATDEIIATARPRKAPRGHFARPPGLSAHALASKMSF